MKSFFWMIGPNFVVLLQFVFLLALLQTRGVAGTASNSTKACPINQFLCDDGDCIPISWKCDAGSDCPDGSDEKDCPTTTCAEGEFRCVQGKCIPLRWTCDNDFDCSSEDEGTPESRDTSDEDKKMCSSQTCSPNEFACLSNVCIPQSWRCDGTSDCKEENGEDEHNCTKLEKCENDMFQCANNQCVSMKWRCDGDDDCKDGSDEVKCKPLERCESNEFQCDERACIDKEWRCDGDIDCNDKTDEMNCSRNSTEKVCTDLQFQCKSGECIHDAWYCDSDPDCKDESDEQCTHHVTCREDQFKCAKDQWCLSNTFRCDGNFDCQDQTDEHNCTKSTVCSDDEFDCKTTPKKCIPKSLVCDGTNNCGNFADESTDLECNNNTCNVKNGGCEQICINKFYNKHECACRPGYALMNGSKTVCDDVDECKDNNIHGICSQLCFNTKGNYKCECMANYSLVNKRYCKAVGGHPELLLADRKDLRRIHLETYNYKLILDAEKIHGAIAMDFDFNGKKFYWTDVSLEQILRADFDNVSDVEVVASTGVNTPDGLAVDWINKYIYWTDTGFDKIEVSSLDGSMRKTLINSGLDEPRAIALDPNYGYVYWTDWGEVPKIERCGMNGDDRKAIITKDIIWPNGLTIDYAANRLYWVDAKLHTIESANMDGTYRVTVLQSHQHLNHPFAITVFEDFLYWTDWPSESVRKFSKFGRNNVTTIALDLHSPMDVHVFHPYRQHTTDNGRKLCANHKCSHLCLPKPMRKTDDYKNGAKLHSCACPNGFTLNNDGITCREGEHTTGSPKPGSVTPMPTKPDSPNRSHNRSSSQGTKVVVTTPTVKSEVTTEHRIEISSEGPGGYTVVNQQVNETKPHAPQHKAEENTGHIAAIVIGVLSAVIIIVAIVCVVLYKRYSRNHGKSMNFDNPVYRKTTTEELIIEKNRPTLPSSMQPLTQNNEIV